MRRTSLLVAGVATLVLTAAPLAQNGPANPPSKASAAPTTTPDEARIARLKTAAVSDVESMKDFTQQMVDSIFSFAELGFQETETHRYLIDILKKNGFTVQEGIAGIPTAFMATWGSGKPVIALGSDIDGIPQASQKPGVAYHSPMIEGAPGHGEGHNSGQAVNVTAAIAVKKIMEREKLSGTIRIWPGTAEELVGTKAYFVRDGFFKDVDVALFTHVSNDLSVSWGDRDGTGLVSVEYTFKGQTAHSAGAPWRGRSALDAVELMNIGWNFRREHLPLEHRSHYVIVDGGDQPNVVPRTASVWYYFRQTTYPKIKELWGIADSIAKGAAMMSGTELESTRVLGSAWPQHFNKVVAETTWANIQKVGMPEWSEADQTLAKALQKELGSPQQGLALKVGTTLHRTRARQPRRRLRRHRRHLVERADGHASLPVQHPRTAGSQLGQCDLDGDADRPQGRDRRRQDPGDDDARPGDEAGAGRPGLGVFPQRPDQGDQVRAADPAAGQAGDRDEQGDHGSLPAGAEEVLLRSVALQDLPRAARDQLPDGEAVGRDTWRWALPRSPDRSTAASFCGNDRKYSVSG